MFRSSLSLATVLVFMAHMFVIGGASVAVKNFPDEPRGEPRRQNHQNVASSTLNLDLSKRRYVPDPPPTPKPLTNTFDPDVGVCSHGPTMRSLPSQKYTFGAVRVLHVFRNMPFVRRTLKYDEHRWPDLPMCASVFITHKWVLTSGHCIRYNNPPTTYTVRGYGIFVTRTPSYHRHPRFADKKENFDVGIVYTERPNNSIRPICVPTSDTDPPKNTKCVATGWSFAHSGGRNAYAPHYEYVKITVVNSEEFYVSYSQPLSRPIEKLDGILWCSSKDGDPLRAVGIMTYRDKKRHLLVFARISRFVGWIKKKLRGPIITYIGKD